MPGNLNRVIPLEPVFKIRHFSPFGVVRVCGHLKRLSGSPIKTGDLTAVGAGIYDVRIFRMHGNMPAFTTANGIPILLGTYITLRLAWNRNCGIILLSTIYAIGKTVIYFNPVELSGWLIFLCSPCLSPIQAHICI